MSLNPSGHETIEAEYGTGVNVPVTVKSELPYDVVWFGTALLCFKIIILCSDYYFVFLWKLMIYKLMAIVINSVWINIYSKYSVCFYLSQDFFRNECSCHALCCLHVFPSSDETEWYFEFGVGIGILGPK